MVAQVGALKVTVGADITGLQTGMRRAQRQVSQSAGAMERAVKGVNASLTGLGRIGGVTLGAAGLIAGASAFLKIADAAKSLRAQLKLATSEYGSFEKANQDVRSIAEKTRSDLLATAELYAALQRNSGQLGTTQEQVARATQTVAQAFKISGAATSEQSAATRQLIQAFQSGVLRGDEFNSIMENAPRLARLLADSLGVTVGKLREMAHAGELTADKLVKAFTDTKFTKGIDEEFKQLPVTFDEAMSQLYNSAVITFSAFDRGGQFSTSLATFVTDGSAGFAELEQRAYQFGVATADTVDAIKTVIDALGLMKITGLSAFLALTDAVGGWHTALSGTLGVLDGVANAFANLANAPGNLLRNTVGIAPIINPFNMRDAFLKSTADRRIGAQWQQIRQGTKDFVGAGRTPPPYRPPPPKGKKGAKGKATPRDRSDEVEYQFEQDLRRAQRDVLQAQRDLARTADARAAIALKILDIDKAIQDAELKEQVRKAERDFAEKKITAGALDQVKVNAEQLRFEFDKKDALERQAIAEELTAQKAEDAARLRTVDLDIQEETLQLQRDLATTASQRRDIELKLLDIARQKEQAAIAELAASKEIADQEEARRRQMALNANYAMQKQGVLNSTRGPMEDYFSSVPKNAAETAEAMERLKVQGIDGAIDSILALSEGFESMRDTAINAIKQIIAELIRMQLMKLAMNLIGSAAGGGFSSAGLVSGNMAALGSGGIPLGASGGGLLPFASGGSGIFKGIPGIDRNIISMNGLPIAKVSHGERFRFGNDNKPMGGMGSPTINIHVSGMPNRSTMDQISASVRGGLASAARKGVG